MSRCTTEEVMYFKEILAEHLQTNYPQIRMSEKEIIRRSRNAALLYYRDDLTCTEVIRQQFELLLSGDVNNRTVATNDKTCCIAAD